MALKDRILANPVVATLVQMQKRTKADAADQFAASIGFFAFVSLIPLIAFALINANQNFPFGGTSILIMVGVALDTVKQIESQLQQRNYEGFLR